MTHSLPRHAALVGIALAFEPFVALAAENAGTRATLARQRRRQLSGGPARLGGARRGAAAAYYLDVLKLDPHNTDLLSRAFLSELTAGEIDDASKLADRLLAIDHTDRISRLVIGIRELKKKHYAAARDDFTQSVRGPVTDLTATLLSAWALAGQGDTHEAVDTLDKLTGPDWYGIFKDLHAGLILDMGKDKKAAGKRYLSAYTADPTALRTVEAYGRYLSRTASKDDALKVYQDFAKVLPNHPLINEEMKQISDGRSCRRSSIRRRPAPPKRCTGSAPRSDAAAARTWR